MAAHSTVTYVEPNINVGLTSATTQDKLNRYDLDIWHPNDGFDRAPRLEDYCIALNLEVEISSRDVQGRRDVLILQWSGDDDKVGVSFMGGTKIGGYKVEGTHRYANLTSADYLTTYYSDMYVGDLVDYGTTEMVGIKSVNIQYEKSCVPIISIKFTDVRGISLFQPTELSRTNSYDGIRGLNKDNVAQSFFQCFFKMPLPKFTIYIKGFYGKPVAYEMMCDKFETNFNSETGDYDVDTRFVGYAYSFLTDISFDALLAAPYSDFFGKKYWDDQVNGNNPRFFLWDKLHTKKMPMPTLYEIHSEFMKLLKSSPEEMLDTTLTSEELTHEEEINKLRSIKEKYQIWYEELFTILKEKYNKRYCFDFKESQKENSEWYRIMILTNGKTSKVKNLSEDYKQYSESFKKTTNDLYAAIEEFNSSGSSYKKLENISKDFSKYTRVEVFNDCYVNGNNRKIEFGGFSRECKLNKTQITNRLFYGVNSDLDIMEENAYDAKNDTLIEEIKGYRKDLKDFTLSTIYGDGVDQYRYAYVIEVDYSDITRRIKALEADSNKSSEQKEKAKRRKEHNRIMMDKMNWYPSVENFMKVVMAHIETYMMMLYKVKKECANRTPDEMDVTIGPNGDACDVNPNSTTIPPFPRVTKHEIGDDGIPKIVDEWIGNYEGKKRFIEADLVNGLFNAVDYLQEMSKRDREALGQSEVSETQTIPLIKHPLTSYDFHLTKNPYGMDNDVSNNPNAFAGKVAMRMFNILSLSNFKKEYGDSWSFARPEFLEQLGAMEAENFHFCVPITNKTMLQMLGINGGEGVITPESIITCVKSNTAIGGDNDIPWRNKKETLFDNDFWLSRYTTCYNQSTKTRLYPIQNMSFKTLNGSLEKFNKSINSIDADNDDIMVSWIDADSNGIKLLESDNKTCFGNLYISDDYKVISNVLENSCSSPTNTYKEVYDLIHESSVFNPNEFAKMIYPSGVFKPKNGIITPKKEYHDKLQKPDDDLYIIPNKEGSSSIIPNITNITNSVLNGAVKYSFDINKLGDYTSEVENKNITSWFFTECRGFTYKNGSYQLDTTKSFFTQDNYLSGITQDKLKWGYGGTTDERMGFFLMGLEAIDYSAVAAQLNNNKTFVYLPKLAVLQIGAALATLSNIKDNVGATGRQIITKIFQNYKSILSSKIPLPRTFESITNYLDRISYTTRIAYIRYFRDWVEKNNAFINDILFRRKNNNVAVIFDNGGGLTRTLFNEDTELTRWLANELMNAVVLTKGSVNHYRGISKNELMFSNSTAKSFLRGFLSRLRELYGVSGTSGGDAVKLAAEPNKTTDDMKKEFYRYMKLVYEKWIPSMEEEEWKFETFFDIKEEKRIRTRGAGGHLFHFIDSFYNKIGDKLLINPLTLSDIIDSALDAKNVNTMALGFIADVLSKNKAMLLCLQNFQDLSEPAAMEMMFRPIPYNSIRDVNKHPDFVILYPYEPSKYLNVDNGEFNDDSFMLNDEFYTPLAIKGRGSKPNSYYQIPAFGVSYGKQYQSYFKKVNVGMQSPIATQQAIMAKHAILRRSQDAKAQTTVAQDLYDIYSTQSYTCTVEMMGCAWVQPLMYFVLTNVPMFKGSYLIFKVTHQITPGNMTTTFMGTRMANVSNRLVDEIFTDDDFDSIQSEEVTEDRRNALANVNNDCPYKVYPLFESDVQLSKNELENAHNAMKMLMSSGFTKTAAAGICGNIYKESTWNLYVTNRIGAFGLCQWTSSGERKEKLFKKYDTQKPSFSQQIEFIVHEWNGGDSIAHKHKDELMDAKSPDSAAEIVCKYFERPGKAEADIPTRKAKATAYYNSYKENSMFDRMIEKINPNNKDIYNGFLNAVQKSLYSTNCNTVIIRDNKNSTSDKLRIIQQGGGNEKMDLVFDIILNGYYEYVQTLIWGINGSDYTVKPSYIDVTVSQNVKPNERLVQVSNDGKWYEVSKIVFSNDSSGVNQSLLKSLYKRYKADTRYKKEIPQFTNFDIFKEIQVKDCNTLMTNEYVGLGNNSTWAKAVQTMGKWYEKNIHTYQSSTPPNKARGRKMYTCSLINGQVGDDCSSFVSACLQYFSVFSKGFAPTSKEFVSGNTKVTSQLINGKFKKINYSWEKVQPYDIIAYDGHVEILSDKEGPRSWGWGSVHDALNGRSGMPARTGPKPKGNTYQTIWRYIG